MKMQHMIVGYENTWTTARDKKKKINQNIVASTQKKIATDSFDRNDFG